MRFAPPNPLRIADRASGLNAPSVRSYNERLVLSLLLQNEGTSRLEIGEKTRLSAQTVSVLVRSLEQEGLVAKGEAQRGRVGPPTIPLSLNPEGAYAVGVSFGAQAVDVVLIDFVGRVRHHSVRPYRALRGATELLRAEVDRAVAAIPNDGGMRLAGVGLAVPEDVRMNDDVEGILGRDLTEAQRRLEHELGHPVYMQNDITAAASGETLFGVAKSLTDFLFLYLGSHLHSRLILNHQIFKGSAGGSDPDGLQKLRDALGSSDFAELGLEGHPSLASRRAYDAWRRALSETIAEAVQTLLRFVDLKAIVLSSYAPPAVGQALLADLQRALPDMTVHLGNSVAPKAVGAASLPYHSRFMVQ